MTSTCTRTPGQPRPCPHPRARSCPRDSGAPAWAADLLGEREGSPLCCRRELCSLSLLVNSAHAHEEARHDVCGGTGKAKPAALPSRAFDEGRDGQNGRGGEADTRGGCLQVLYRSSARACSRARGRNGVGGDMAKEGGKGAPCGGGGQRGHELGGGSGMAGAETQAGQAVRLGALLVTRGGRSGELTERMRSSASHFKILVRARKQRSAGGGGSMGTGDPGGGRGNSPGDRGFQRASQG